MPEVTLNWTDNNSGADQEDGHRVYRSLAPIDPLALPAPIAVLPADTTSYVDASAPSGTVYYAVSAYKGAVEKVSASMSISLLATGWRYFRWNITAGSGGPYLQAMEFQLLSGGVPVVWDPAVVVTDNKSNPATEVPQNLVDGNSGTKWLAYSSTCIVDIDNVNGVIFDEYRFMTGNDAADRDPDSWTLEVSNDGTTWTVVSTVTGAAVTASRSTWTRNFSTSQ